jgi:hypothetical protein
MAVAAIEMILENFLDFIIHGPFLVGVIMEILDVIKVFIWTRYAGLL